MIMETSITYDSSSSSGNEDGNINIYKLRKEQFVFGLEGATPYELLFICLTTFMGIALYYYYCDNYCHVNDINRIQQQEQQHKSVVASQIAGEILCFFIPMILCQTIWIYPYGMIYVTIEFLLSIFILYNNKSNTNTSKMNFVNTAAITITKESTDMRRMQQIQSITITIYRGCILVLTIISILGIDFHIYPRRFGKTEITGYSLMDLGAASFIIMAAISSSSSSSSSSSTSRITRSSYNEGSSQDQTTTSTNQTSRTRGTNFQKQIQKMIPVLIMGTIRLITHKGIDYPEHNSEYGIHWNFFYTLAFIIPTTSIVKSYLYKTFTPNYWILPVLMFCMYQYILSYQNLQDFIVHAPRTCPRAASMTFSYIVCDLWYANREGIVGCISYTALYLLSNFIAHTYFWNQYKKESIKEPSMTNHNVPVWETTKSLWYMVVALFALWQVLVTPSVFDFDVSRRSTNTIFCIWVLFVNLFQFVSIYTIVLLCFNVSVKPQSSMSLHLKPPILLSSINQNGLYIFIIANLFTGIINLSIDTLSVSNYVAICILLMYVSMVGYVSLLLDYVRSNRHDRISSQSNEIVKED